MNVLGLQNTAAFSSEPDIKDWANRVALNPARVPPEHAGSAELDGVQERVAGPRGARVGATRRADGLRRPCAANACHPPRLPRSLDP